MAVGASAASAATFYVNQRGTTTTTCLAKGSEACLTINEAVARAQKAAPPNTIEVETEEADELYAESLNLNAPSDAGLTIVSDPEAAGDGVEIESKKAPAVSTHVKGAITLSNLEITQLLAPEASKMAIADHGGELTLDDDVVENQASEGLSGVTASEHGSLTINGGRVVMEDGAAGYAVEADEAQLSLSGVTVVDEGLGQAGGIKSQKSTVSAQSSSVTVEGGGTVEDVGIVAEEDTSVSLQEDTVRQEGAALGVALEQSPTTVNGLNVKMEDAASKVEGVGTSVASATFEHLEVGGTWQGPPFLGIGGDISLSDSRLSANAAAEVPALEYVGIAEDTGLVVRRSVLQAGEQATPGALVAIDGNATIDSSEIFGGTDGVSFKSEAEATTTLTLAASTMDAPPGFSAEKPGVVGVGAEALGTHGSSVNVTIEGSIVPEAQVATTAAGDHATVSCTYSAVPSQIQTANTAAHEGEIGCGAGSNGNTNSSSETTPLFAEPLKNRELSASSSAIDSVPVSAITLPFGLMPSSTDLEGNPRFEGVNCVLLQDKGALELPGQGKVCPSAPPSSSTGPPSATPTLTKPLTGILTALTLSPSAFFAARSGATVSAVAASKKKYGTKITYRDSRAATTTFTVLLETSGRKHGKTCQKPSSKNKHGKRCTLLKKVGTFAHTDIAGANSLHFSGRIKGKKLPAGTYELQVVAHDAAGNGKPAEKSFKIEG
jgi:hypothetical protein